MLYGFTDLHVSTEYCQRLNNVNTDCTSPFSGQLASPLQLTEIIAINGFKAPYEKQYSENDTVLVTEGFPPRLALQCHLLTLLTSSSYNRYKYLCACSVS